MRSKFFPPEDQAVTDEEIIDDKTLDTCFEGKNIEKLLPRDICGRVEVTDNDEKPEAPGVSNSSHD